MSENLKLWQSVEKTDPKYTKSFSKAGGFSGTAINATYLVRKATELWGPYGGQWGATVEDEKYVPGAGETIVHVVRIKFRHPNGEFPSYGQTTFVGQNKNGPFTDEEAPKKSLTDALTKALSMLGFSADVFLGLYDDNKYVNDRKAEFSGTKGTITPNDNALDNLNESELGRAQMIAKRMVELDKASDLEAARVLFYENSLTNEMQLGVWHFLQPHSSLRNRVKKLNEAKRAEAKAAAEAAKAATEAANQQGATA